MINFFVIFLEDLNRDFNEVGRQAQLFNVVLKVYVCCIYNGKIRTLSQHRNSVEVIFVSITYNEKK